jgi:hypothetical protein
VKRRTFLKKLVLATAVGPPLAGEVLGAEAPPPSSGSSPARLDPALVKDWLGCWEKSILNESRTRCCDRENGEEIGWLMSPFLNGFYYGYLATGDVKWVERLVEWADAWIKRGVIEPDGFVGWPKSGTGGMVEEGFFTDSLLGEAMGLRPVVLMAGQVLKDPTLKERFGGNAESYLDLANRVFEKWVSRGCWREVQGGGVWVVPNFGIDKQTGKWTESYARRRQEGFSNPANKQNHIARWLLAMHKVTGKPVYKEHAERWFRLMKTRLKTREAGKYLVWDYWDPSGPWDFKPDGSRRHWVGVHPNGGYYAIDVEGMVAAFEHGVVFTMEDMERLVATNRDFMWNQRVTGAAFRRIDGGEPDQRWKDTPGVLWTALVPYDERLKEVFLANHKPGGWGGLMQTPWFISRQMTQMEQKTEGQKGNAHAR